MPFWNGKSPTAARKTKCMRLVLEGIWKHSYFIQEYEEYRHIYIYIHIYYICIHVYIYIHIYICIYLRIELITCYMTFYCLWRNLSVSEWFWRIRRCMHSVNECYCIQNRKCFKYKWSIKNLPHKVFVLLTDGALRLYKLQTISTHKHAQNSCGIEPSFPKLGSFPCGLYHANATISTCRIMSLGPVNSSDTPTVGTYRWRSSTQKKYDRKLWLLVNNDCSSDCRLWKCCHWMLSQLNVAYANEIWD